MCIYIYIIYIYREREMRVYIYIYMHIHIHVYIYIYITSQSCHRVAHAGLYVNRWGNRFAQKWPNTPESETRTSCNITCKQNMHLCVYTSAAHNISATMMLRVGHCTVEACGKTCSIQEKKNRKHSRGTTHIATQTRNACTACRAIERVETTLSPLNFITSTSNMHLQCHAHWWFQAPAPYNTLIKFAASAERSDTVKSLHERMHTCYEHVVVLSRVCFIINTCTHNRAHAFSPQISSKTPQ